MTVSCPVQLFNDGNRGNRGAVMPSGSFQPTAIYLGQVGSRFERSAHDLMEWRHMVADTGRNYADYPMLRFFEKFYGVTKGTMTGPSIDHSNIVSATCPVVPLQGNRQQQFKLEVVASRYRKSAEVHLAEAQFYGDKYNQDVRIYAVGLGTGAWAPDDTFVGGNEDGRCGQALNALIIQSYIELIQERCRRRRAQYSRIKVVEFAFHKMKKAFLDNRQMFLYGGELTEHPDGRLSFQDPLSKVTFVFHGTGYRSAPFVQCKELIVANYAWDSNSFPGNEYWMGLLSASGDPAAACCSTIWNHMNPVLNKRFMSGDNARVMLKKGGFKMLVEYRN